MSQIIEIMPAAATKRFDVAGRFFRLVSAVGAVNIEFFRDKRRINETVHGVTTGFYFRGEFDAFEVYSAGGDSLNMITSMGEVGYSDSVTVAGGSVAIAPETGVTQAAATVTNASAVLNAANPGRTFLAVQNKSSSGTIYINLTGGAATVANGIEIPPKGYWESPAHFCPTGNITAIGSIANNPDVVVVEGA